MLPDIMVFNKRLNGISVAITDFTMNYLIFRLLSHSYDSGGGNVLGTASNTETSSSGDNEGATPLVQPLSLKCDE
jgi:hypothetical protein